MGALAAGHQDTTGVVRFGGRIFATTYRILGGVCGRRRGGRYGRLGRTCGSIYRRACGSPKGKCIGIRFLSSARSVACVRGALRRLKRRIRLLITRNIRLGSVTVLIHGGEDVPLVTSCFSGGASCGVMSSRTFQLSTSLTMYVVVSNLHCLSRPRGQVTGTRLTTTCRGRMLRGKVSLGALLLGRVSSCLPFSFVGRTRRLHLVPLCRLVRGLFGLFRVSYVRRRSTCLYTFFSTIARCLRDGSSRLSTFVAC